MSFAKAPYLSQRSSKPPPKLGLAADVERPTTSYLALSEMPWLRIDCDGSALADRWVRLSYRTNLLDPLVRPVLRCFVDDSYRDEILPGALFGRAFWIGHVPAGTQEIWISPTNRPGPFDFALETLAPIATADLVWQCFRRNPRRCLTGVGAHFIGLRYAAKTEFRRVLSATSLEEYHAWRERRIRALDIEGMDHPRTDWSRGPHIRFVVAVPGDADTSTALKSVIDQLRQQPYPHWTLVAVSAQGFHDPASYRAEDGRLKVTAPDISASDLLDDLTDQDIIAPLAAGDVIPPYALAVLAGGAQRDPRVDVFYGDEDSVDSLGRYSSPRLYPEWSPIFFAHRPYFGAAVFFRAGMFRPFSHTMRAGDCSVETMLELAFRQNPIVSHIGRIMRTSRASNDGVSAPMLEKLRPTQPEPADRTTAFAVPHATIIITTKDRSELLARCIEGLQRNTRPKDIEIIVVDNGSTEEAACSLLAALAHDPRIRVLSRPGPFDFAKMCNDAAAEARAAVLVFLNNDTEIVQADWLEPLTYWAGHPEIGAVGAKLLYRDRHVQHAGVVLGIDGRAAHFERMAADDEPGYFGSLCVPHEVSAVTAACLAIQKRKFDQIGGFDAVNFPVELNDVDLCLRLQEQGWISLCVPDSVLIHHEAASRGKTHRPDEVYRSEHIYFRHRWINRLRDDPYFHPALSLDALGPALG